MAVSGVSFESISMMLAGENSDLPKSEMPPVEAPSFDFSTTSFFRGVWIFYFAYVIVATVALSYGHLVDTERQVPAPPIAFVIVYSAFFVLAVIFAVPTFLEGRNGTYRVDGTGIGFRPILGQAFFIAWSDIERVKWMATGAVIAGNNRKLVLNLNFLPREHRFSSKSAVKAWLSPYFDLPEKRKRRPATGREILKMWRQLLLYLLPALGLVAYA